MWNWSYIRTAMAVSLTGSYQAAAQKLNITSSTVSRHIEALERKLSQPIFVWKEKKWVPTEIGIQLIKASTSFDMDLSILEKSLGKDSARFMPLTISSISYINKYLLVPHIQNWVETYPRFRLTLDASDDVVAVEDGWVDAAIRLTRPSQIGLARLKVGLSPVAIYQTSRGNDQGWIGLPESLDRLPEMQIARDYYGEGPTIRLDSYCAIAQAAISTDLACILPTCISLHFEELREIRSSLYTLTAIRDVWFLFHEKRKSDPSIQALKSWVNNSFSGPNKCLCGRCEAYH